MQDLRDLKDLTCTRRTTLPRTATAPTVRACKIASRKCTKGPSPHLPMFETVVRELSHACRGVEGCGEL